MHSYEEEKFAEDKECFGGKYPRGLWKSESCAYTNITLVGGGDLSKLAVAMSLGYSWVRAVYPWTTGNADFHIDHGTLVL
jgi:hypothetical protein